MREKLRLFEPFFLRLCPEPVLAIRQFPEETTQSSAGARRAHRGAELQAPAAVLRARVRGVAAEEQERAAQQYDPTQYWTTEAARRRVLRTPTDPPDIMRAGKGTEEEEPEPEPEPEPAGPVVDCGDGGEDGVGGAGVPEIRFVAPPPGFDYESISWSEIWYETGHFLIHNFA